MKSFTFRRVLVSINCWQKDSSMTEFYSQIQNCDSRNDQQSSLLMLSELITMIKLTEFQYLSASDRLSDVRSALQGLHYIARGKGDAPSPFPLQGSSLRFQAPILVLTCSSCATMPVRVVHLVFSMICLIWALTVGSLMPNSQAISLLVHPFARFCTTVSSRSVN
jgi:hypothetical protein